MHVFVIHQNRQYFFDNLWRVKVRDAEAQPLCGKMMDSTWVWTSDSLPHEIREQ